MLHEAETFRKKKQLLQLKAVTRMFQWILERQKAGREEAYSQTGRHVGHDLGKDTENQNIRPGSTGVGSVMGL